MDDLKSEIERLQGLVNGHFSFQFLSAAVELDLFTLLSREPDLTRAQITERLQLQEQPARVLLLGCTSLGLLRKNGASYRCTDAAKFMFTGGTPWDQRTLVRWGSQTYAPMGRFLESLRRNTNVGLEEVEGTAPTLYGRLAHAPALEAVFHDMMGTVTRLVSKLLVAKTDLATARRLLDVGGGDGTNAIALATRWPALRVTIFDLPSVCSAARARIAAAGLADRIDTVPGDCFADELPTGYDRVLFAHFLEIWSPAMIAGLLDKAQRACVVDGEVLLVNVMQDDDETGPVASANASAYFLALASGTGMAYTWNEYDAGLRAAGWTPSERLSLAPPHGLIRATRR